MSHYQLRFDLLHRIHRDAYDDQQGGAPEGELNPHPVQKPRRQAVEVSPDDRQMVNVEACDHEFRDDGDQGQIDRSRKGDPGKDRFHVLGSLLSGADAWNEPAILPHVVSNLGRVEHDGGIEVAEEDDARDV